MLCVCVCGVCVCVGGGGGGGGQYHRFTKQKNFIACTNIVAQKLRLNAILQFGEIGICYFTLYCTCI